MTRSLDSEGEVVSLLLSALRIDSVEPFLSTGSSFQAKFLLCSDKLKKVT